MNTVSSHPFDALKARYCIAAIAIAWYWQPGFWTIVSTIPKDEWYWPGILSYAYSDLLITAFIIVCFRVNGKAFHLIRGRALRKGDLTPIVFFTYLSFFGSLGLNTLLMVPTSYLLPSFVTWWIDWSFQPFIFIDEFNNYELIPNLLGFTTLVIAAPVIEELIFRGYLLHRWARKWGLTKGVLLSSFLFGAIHSDPLAAAMTGVLFSILYLRTQSIFAPIIAHSLYNLTVWLADAYGFFNEGYDYYIYTLEQLQEEWWLGGIALIITAFLAKYAIRHQEILMPLKLPDIRPKGQ